MAQGEQERRTAKAVGSVQSGSHSPTQVLSVLPGYSSEFFLPLVCNAGCEGLKAIVLRGDVKLSAAVASRLAARSAASATAEYGCCLQHASGNSQGGRSLPGWRPERILLKGLFLSVGRGVVV